MVSKPAKIFNKSLKRLLKDFLEEAGEKTPEAAPGAAGLVSGTMQSGVVMYPEIVSPERGLVHKLLSVPDLLDFLLHGDSSRGGP
jgi:hypothetical protein